MLRLNLESNPDSIAALPDLIDWDMVTCLPTQVRRCLTTR